ncbi:hypothetical protein [Terrisporobacter hibernicus]|uniref:Lipoprotein n=1 Tax=Terrisporobacter hibernicus TaxID=2813371 RepID=A0AAX2ZJP4_9FIRM|nr:hypothetical protein [Terrisporobacter hibernicus]UEL48319.1 hypothetical protein JW646_02370 [Terrisporobacter hibernicus]
MKFNKKLLGLVIVSTLTLSFVGCGSSELDEQKESEKQAEQQQETNVDLNNLTSYEDVKSAYDANIEKIMNKEQVQELDMKSIKLDDVIEKANKAKDIVDTIENTSDKISTIDKLVSIDDLSNNTTEDTMKETLKYIIAEYENGNLENNPETSLYIVRYLDTRLDNHPNMKDADELVFDMYQICKDTIRGIEDSIDSNKEQINEKLQSVKSSLN